jgi:hypothetical protein
MLEPRQRAASSGDIFEISPQRHRVHGDGTMKEPFRINLLSEFFVPVWY